MITEEIASTEDNCISTKNMYEFKRDR